MNDEFEHTRFTHNDEWITANEGRWRIGITDFAQRQLGDIIHVELPEVDEHHCEADEELGVIESLSGSMELHSPVAGTITAVNTDLLSHSELINTSPYEDGWIVEMTVDDETHLDELMDVDEYEADLPDEDDDEE